MTKSTTRIAALFCTIVMSATCLFGALAPSQVGPQNPVAVERQIA